MVIFYWTCRPGFVIVFAGKFAERVSREAGPFETLHAAAVSRSYLPGRNVGPFHDGTRKVKVGFIQAQKRQEHSMGSKLYVGNLSYSTTSSDLEQLCGQHGQVQSAEVIQDRD